MHLDVRIIMYNTDLCRDAFPVIIRSKIKKKTELKRNYYIHCR